MSARPIDERGRTMTTKSSVRAGTKRVELHSREVVKPPRRFAQGTRDLQPVVVSQSPLCQDSIANVAHDMKGPLMTIALETTLIEHQCVSGEIANVLKAASRINHNVRFLDRMVHDLLDVAAHVAGKLALVRRDTELRSLIEDVLDRSVATRDQARVFIEADEHVRVLIDDLRIERVLANLVENALKYTPPSSGVVIRMQRSGDEACVSVTDAGPGVSTAELVHMFDPYRRARTSRGRTGYGLGLYTSKLIVEAHGGRIGAESVRGVGSRFFFTLPAIT